MLIEIYMSSLTILTRSIILISYIYESDILRIV